MLDAENPSDNSPENQSAETSPSDNPADSSQSPAPAAKKAPAKKAAAKKTAAKKATASTAKRTAKKTTTKRATKKSDEAPSAGAAEPAPATEPAQTVESASNEPAGTKEEAGTTGATPAATALLFQPPEPTTAPPRRKKAAAPKPTDDDAEAQEPDDQGDDQAQGGGAAGRSGGKRTQKSGSPRNQSGAKTDDGAAQDAPGDTTGDSRGDAGGDDDTDGEGGNRRRRRRGGRRRRKPGGEASGESAGEDDSEGADRSADSGRSGQGSGGDGNKDTDSEDSAGTRRRRRRRRSGDDSDTSKDDPDNTVTRVRKGRSADDEITSLTGSTRLEAKKQRRKEGREAGRRRAPIVSEAEFLARREAVERVMVIRQKKDLTQIAVLEDKVLVEHYVARESQHSLIGNVYLGRVQNVLPSMEAAFIDIGKGRNAVLYAGEVNWDALGAKNGQARKIESVLKSGQPILVQVTKDPSGHKGSRLTSQVSLPGRFLVYVPDGTTSGISRKLPDTERTRLKTLLKEIVPEGAGVIVRTAAEGASEDELTRDVERLTARWDDISGNVAGGNAPQMLYAEPDLTLKVVRDLFTEDFDKLVVSGADAWEMVDGYVEHVAPDLADRLEKHDADAGKDVFAEYRIDEQIAKGLDRKVWLPSGGSLVIDRTEAMTVVDVNTGKFTGSGGNLEETVTRNNLEAAEEIVRQLRLRDIGGIIVVDFIDMVLESNRDLVLRRMVECLGRDRTRHQVAEVTSLGLVQMTRKRIGTGLLEAFSESCEHCLGRGVLVHQEPVEPSRKGDDEPRRNRRTGRKSGRGGDGGNGPSSPPTTPSPKDVAAVAKPENADRPPLDEPERTGVDQPDAVQPDSPAGEPAPTESAAAPGPVFATEPVAAEQQPEQKPAVSRKRSARRAQGPAASTSAEAATAAVIVPDTDGVADQIPQVQTAQTETEQAQTQQTEGAPEAPENGGTASETAAPRIVTSVRRRGASRAAGPPAADPSTEEHSTGEQVPAGESSGDGVGSGAGLDESVASPARPHVPVKRKGSRRH